MNINAKFSATVDGNPISAWIDLEFIDNMDEVRDQLIDEEIIPEDFDGDIKAEDIDALVDVLLIDKEEINWDELESIKSLFNKFDQDAVIAYVTNFREVPTASEFGRVYVGQYDSEEAFCENHYAQTMEIPEHLHQYIDWAAVWCDARHDYSEVDGHYFSS